MRLGAIIIAADTVEKSGFSALLHPVGTVTAVQRMLAAFKCCGVDRFCIVSNHINKSETRKLAQTGLSFICTRDKHAGELDKVKLGLSHMLEKVERVFLINADNCLFLPETLKTMLNSSAELVVPIHRLMEGTPLLLSDNAMRIIIRDTKSATLTQAIASHELLRETVAVTDTGVLAQQSRKAKILAEEKQNRQLLRPELDVKLLTESTVIDGKMAMLLRLIGETGSVKSASELMQISYSSALGLLDLADEDEPWIIRTQGGTSGGGCELTEKGKALIYAYDCYTRELSLKANELYRKIFEGKIE